ncbi:unnamed protein product [Leptidea sinapis]|uniref:Uncharacterized protein n=1 Tax=Leptidea sinapis TaxID=189913 RepID=A0A5E4QW07_9NEOP|nr:unnamed protein product [Leptidea sinapis]
MTKLTYPFQLPLWFRDVSASTGRVVCCRGRFIFSAVRRGFRWAFSAAKRLRIYHRTGATKFHSSKCC